MASIVIADLSNLICSVEENNLCGIEYAVESLYNIYIV